MQNNSFFDESREQSQVKARIVEKYFWSWAKVIIPHAKKRKSSIGYVDLFAGPGSYRDGSKSTPVLVLEKALTEKDIRDMLVSVFNDVNPEYVRNLKTTIKTIPDIDDLRYTPEVKNMEVSAGVKEILEYVKGIPTLFFIDPWGYKGLSIELLSDALSYWGCDCIFFFNFNTINRSIKIESVKGHIDALFGKKRATELRNLPESMNPSDRELSIIETVSQALKENAGQYVLPFRFKSDSSRRSSHYIIFVSKNIRGYQIMKEIMAKESSDTEQGVPSFEYTSATEKQLLLFGYSRTLDELAEMLLTEYADRTMTMKQIFDDHNVGTPYISRNYKEILIKLESDGKIQADRPANKRPKNTFGDTVKVTFPSKNE